MKKTVFISAIAVLLVANSAFAVEIETSGMFEVRGSYISNPTGLMSENVPSFGYYDQELDMNVDLKITDYTKIKTNFEIRDQDWLQSNLDDSTVATGSDLDDNIEFKRIYSTHAFATGTIVDLGLMEGGTWGTKFADNSDGTWRVKVVQRLGHNIVGGLLQKETEVGATELNRLNEDAEKDDGDSYYLFGIFPMGTHKVMPLLVYADRSDVVIKLDQTTGAYEADEDGLKVMVAQLALMGAFGESIGYEAEVDYYNYNQDWDNGEDYNLYGVYLNAWTTIGPTKVGGMVAYGSYDEDGADGFGFGEDFTPTMFGADFAPIGGPVDGSANDEYSAVTLVNLYAEITMNSVLTLFGNGTYWISNSKEDAWEDANGYEIDLGGTYKVTDNVTYDVLAAYGRITLDGDAAAAAALSDDPNAFYRLWHRFTVNF